MPRILFLVPERYSVLQRKGVAGMILERDEHGFFDRVVTVHPIADRSQIIDLTPVHRLIECDLGLALGPDASWWSRVWASARALVLLGGLVRLVRRERIDIIRANDPYLMGLLAYAVARLTRRHFCVSIHTDYDKNFELTPKKGWAGALRRLSVWCPSFVFRRADLILPIREQLARWAEARGARADRMRVIHHGVHLEPFAAPHDDDDLRREYGIAGGAPIVSFIGRLSRYNYVHHVLDVAERVATVRPDAVFVVMGGGDEREALERRLAAGGAAAANVRLLGNQPPGQNIRLRQASAVSLCLMGGFSLIEACAAGSAVIAYDVDWHSEIIEHEVTGLLVPEGDIGGLVSGVVQLLEDGAYAARLGANARAFVAARHDERRTSATKRECYTQLLTAAGAR